MADQRDGVRSLPPSAKLVRLVLEREGASTQKQLAEHTRLSQRTVRYALGELDSLGLLREDVYIRDARKRLYTLVAPESGD